MKRVLVWAILVLVCGLISERASYAQTGESPAAANLAKQAAKSEAAKIDTIVTIGAQFFITSRTTLLPDNRRGIYILSPINNDTLWFSIPLSDSLTGNELHDMAFYGARFEGEPPTWEVSFFLVTEDMPERLMEFKEKENLNLFARNEILRWSYYAQKVFLGKIDIKLDLPSFGKIEPYRVRLREGINIAGKRLGIMVKRPAYNTQSLRGNEESPSAFFALQLTARKASAGNVLTGSLAGNGIAKTQNVDWLSWLIGGAFVFVAVVTILGLARRQRKARNV